MDRAATDLKMMQSPNQWPCWPWLPLKKLGTHEVALLFHSNPPLFFEGENLFTTSKIELTTGRPISTAEELAELVEEGWVVD